MRMSEFEQDPSASTGRFRAFVERGDDDTSRGPAPAVSPAVLIVAAVMVIVVVILVVALA